MAQQNQEQNQEFKLYPKINFKPKHVLTIKTNGNFLWRLWFLVSAPIIWLIKGEVKIK